MIVALVLVLFIFIIITTVLLILKKKGKLKNLKTLIDKQQGGEDEQVEFAPSTAPSPPLKSEKKDGKEEQRKKEQTNK